MLWVWDPKWAELIHPFASVIDTALEAPECMRCVRGDSKPEWVRWPEGEKEVFLGFGDEGIEGWHRKWGKWVD